MIANSPKAILEKMNDYTRSLLHGRPGCLRHPHPLRSHRQPFPGPGPGGRQRRSPRILAYFKVNGGLFKSALQQDLKEMKTGNTGKPGLLARVHEPPGSAWAESSLNLGQASIRTAGLLLALKTLPGIGFPGPRRPVRPGLHRDPAGQVRRNHRRLQGGLRRPRRRRAQCRRLGAGRLDPAALHGQLHRDGPPGQGRSHLRPRQRDPHGHRHPLAPPQEQPHHGGRGRRGQDGGGGGPGPAHRPGAGARHPQEGRDPRPGHGPHGRRRRACAASSRTASRASSRRSSPRPCPSSSSSTRPIPSSARAARPARTTPPTCSSRRWPAASSRSWAPPP